MRYALHPEAANDLRDAAEFYRNHAGIALSQSFFAEFERAVTLLLEHPQLGGRWRRSARRYPMKRFPYFLIYVVSDEEIRILAVAHYSRRPGYWRDRLGAKP